MPNGGLQVVNPSKEVYNLIASKLETEDVAAYEFADQSLLSDIFSGRWVALPYIYNALKTMRWSNVHETIWEDDQVKNIHYILSPKPWDAADVDNKDVLHEQWRRMNVERKKMELEKGISDQF
jgi:lipopolysaccharide biosynthesis glycosyltransferase